MGLFERQLSKSIGAHLEAEVNTKQAWINDKPIYRKVIDCGALPNATTKNVAHGLTFTNILKIYGWATEGTSWLTLPHVDTTTANLIEVRADATNVIIVTAFNYSVYTSSYVTLEYVK